MKYQTKRRQQTIDSFEKKLDKQPKKYQIEYKKASQFKFGENDKENFFSKYEKVLDLSFKKGELFAKNSIYRQNLKNADEKKWRNFYYATRQNAKKAKKDGKQDDFYFWKGANKYIADHGAEKFRKENDLNVRRDWVNKSLHFNSEDYEWEYLQKFNYDKYSEQNSFKWEHNTDKKKIKK